MPRHLQWLRRRSQGRFELRLAVLVFVLLAWAQLIAGGPCPGRPPRRPGTAPSWCVPRAGWGWIAAGAWAWVFPGGGSIGTGRIPRAGSGFLCRTAPGGCRGRPGKNAYVQRPGRSTADDLLILWLFALYSAAYVPLVGAAQSLLHWAGRTWQAEAARTGLRLPHRWQVDAACGTARRAMVHCAENLGYPHRILTVLQPRYLQWGPGL